ncbi:hypothetical protein D3C77_771560 [compost metagenome]
MHVNRLAPHALKTTPVNETQSVLGLKAFVDTKCVAALYPYGTKTDLQAQPYALNDVTRLGHALLILSG